MSEKEKPWYDLPPLAQQFAELLENHRSILMSRKQICELRKQQFEDWVERCAAEDVEAMGENIRKNVVEYFEQELVSLDYLLQVLSEKQREGSRYVAELEMEVDAKKEAKKNG